MPVARRLLLRGALDWGRAILREDANRSSYDALSERLQYSYQDVRQVGPDLRLTLRPVETRP